MGVNAEMMSLFLAEVAPRHTQALVLMVMDQAGWHIAGDLQVLPNMRLMFLPPYSPELNPAEPLCSVESAARGLLCQSRVCRT